MHDEESCDVPDAVAASCYDCYVIYNAMQIAGLSEGVVLWEFEDENMSYSKQNEKMMIQKTSSSVKADLVKT